MNRNEVHAKVNDKVKGVHTWYWQLFSVTEGFLSGV